MTEILDAPPRHESSSRRVPKANGSRPDERPRLDLAKTIQWMIRISMAGTYIGHGAFGIIGKEAWLPYFNLFGFTDSQGWALMPIVGTMDIAFGILILVWPMRFLMLHLTAWGVMTGMFRPLTGEGTWQEIFERAGNYSPALALLVLSGVGGDTISGWFRRVSEAPVLTKAKADAMHWILRVGTSLLLIGHGGFGAWMHKKVWLGYFAELGISADTVTRLDLFHLVGWFEILFGLAILIKPFRALLVAAVVYKVGTELLRPAAGEPWWEFIERAGSYLAPAALLVVDRWRRQDALETTTEVPAVAGMETVPAGPGVWVRPAR